HEERGQQMQKQGTSVPAGGVPTKQDVVHAQPYEEQRAVVIAGLVICGIRPQVRGEIRWQAVPVADGWIPVDLLMVVIDEVKAADRNVGKKRKAKSDSQQKPW